MPCRCWSICPIMVGSSNCKYRFTLWVVRPGHPTKWLFSIAFRRVDLVGKYRLKCRNLMMSLVTASCTVKFAMGGLLVGCAVVGNDHRPLVSLGPVRTGRLLCRMTTLSASKVAMHPASHSFPMEMSECDNSGRTCAVMLIGAGRGSRP